MECTLWAYQVTPGSDNILYFAENDRPIAGAPRSSSEPN